MNLINGLRRRFGHVVSKHCKAVLPKILAETGYDQERAISVLQSDLESSAIDIECSGCTCVTAIVKQNRTIEVGNVGDSRAIILQRSPNNTLKALPLSIDHKPSQLDERKRILETGGRIASKHCSAGPSRVWFEYNNTTMGLAMSRSVGDEFAHRVGVSHEPQIFHHKIEPQDTCIVLASDGLWDVYSNDEVAHLIQTCINGNYADWNAKIAAVFLTKMARMRWEHISTEHIDDVTCLVIKIEPQRTFQFDF
uniref:PPM-type phosphatase domain-containing protein n=1 Tax=Leptocylindrus danicus TaxID=163516 RepID=A0A7S2NWT3_9STRA|mmetsp:Transcript_15378/g.22699  ORF Transcript_15378/g.22699 Transcript_15378/m.22699 type:complete len:252 (+) Transcript_15378:594-1349(+)